MKRSRILFIFFTIMMLSVFIDCKEKKKWSQKQQINEDTLKTLSYAYFGGGCFWCVQAMFEDLRGVYEVESGYSGGFVQNPAYKEVKKGITGHAEVIKITYDSKVISFGKLLYIFMHAHDPTTYHRQGIDSGSQYRSVVYYQNQDELRTTKKIFKDIEQAGSYSGYPEPILTEVALFGKFYPAESYHQNYFSQNPYDQQCSSIIAPKVQKMRKLFKEYYEDQQL